MEKEISEQLALIQKRDEASNGEAIRYSFLVPKIISILIRRLEGINFNASLANGKPNTRLNVSTLENIGSYEVFLDLSRDKTNEITSKGVGKKWKTSDNSLPGIRLQDPKIVNLPRA